MSIAFNCANCGAKVRGSEKYAGRQGSCPSCKKQVKVPATSDSAPGNAPPPRKTRRPQPRDVPEASAVENTPPPTDPAAAFDFGAPMELREQAEPPSRRPERGRQTQAAPRQAAPAPPTAAGDPFAFHEPARDEAFDLDDAPPAGEGQRPAPGRGSGDFGPDWDESNWDDIHKGMGFVELGVLSWFGVILLSMIMSGVTFLTASITLIQILMIVMALLLLGGEALMFVGRLSALKSPRTEGTLTVGRLCLFATGFTTLLFLAFTLSTVMLLVGVVVPEVMFVGAIAYGCAVFAWPGTELIYVAYLNQIGACLKEPRSHGYIGRFLMYVGSWVTSLGVLYFVFGVGFGLFGNVKRVFGAKFGADDLGDVIALTGAGAVISFALWFLAGFALLWMYQQLIANVRRFVPHTPKEPAPARRSRRPARDDYEDDGYDDFDDDYEEEPPPRKRGQQRRR